MLHALPLAHFTPTELPGTFAVLCMGIVAGLALARRDGLLIGTALIAFTIFATVSWAGDTVGWPSWIKQSIDVIALASALVVGLLVYAADRRERRGERDRQMLWAISDADHRRWHDLWR